MFEILKYTEIKDAGALVGKFDLCVIKWGEFIFHGCSHFQKGEAHWIAFPSTKYQDDGVDKWAPMGRFRSTEMMKHFTKKAVHALKDYLLHHKETMQDD